MHPLPDVPLEQRRLFDPAFLAVVFFSACKGYENNSQALPLPLAFLITTAALNGETRASLPKSTTMAMRKWVRENPGAILNLEVRRSELLPFMARGITLGISTGVLIGVPLAISAGKYQRPARLEAFDAKDICASARWLGSWFERQTMNLADLLALWKVGV